jgi:hypothetical protein
MAFVSIYRKNYGSQMTGKRSSGAKGDFNGLKGDKGSLWLLSFTQCAPCYRPLGLN